MRFYTIFRQQCGNGSSAVAKGKAKATRQLNADVSKAIAEVKAKPEFNEEGEPFQPPMEVFKYNTKGSPITSYDNFESTAQKIIDKATKKGENSMTIQEMRAKIGTRVSRDQFDKWMLDMQGNDKFQLMSGEIVGSTRNIIGREGITPPVGKKRYIIKWDD